MLLQKMLKIDINGTTINKHKQVPETFKSNVLNNPARFRKLARIHEDNKTFLNRLKNVKSQYSTRKWAESRKYNRYLAANISRNAGRVKKNRSNSYGMSSTSMSRTDGLIQRILDERHSRPGHTRPGSIGSGRP